MTYSEHFELDGASYIAKRWTFTDRGGEGKVVCSVIRADSTLEDELIFRVIDNPYYRRNLFSIKGQDIGDHYSPDDVEFYTPYGAPA